MTTSLKTKKVGTYTVQEASYEIMKPMMNGGDDDMIDTLLRKTVYDKDGALVGDGVDKIGFQTIEKLMTAITEVNGMAAKKD